jgi:plastocyanin
MAPSRSRPGLLLLALSSLLVLTPLSWLADRPARAQADASHGHPMTTMSRADMERMDREWRATHPAPPLRRAAGVPVDTFLVAGVTFDANHDGATTQVDTVTIFQGETVLWKWVSGLHTVTDGTGAADPTAGSLFDQTISSGEFAFTFDDPGVVPFFCRFHEGLNMKGAVVVLSTADVAPLGAAAGLGFVTAPAPNPTHGTASFRFAVARAGRVRLAVLDTQGRRIAAPLDREFAAGSYAAAWDGRDLAGRAVPSGAYLLRLEVPGSVQVKLIALER